MQNTPDNGTVNRPVEALSYLPSSDIGEWFIHEIRNREKLILEMGGEPVKLLKRRFDGTKCTVCWDDIRKQGRANCPACFGTGVTAGYYDTIPITVSLVNPATRVVAIQEHGQKREVTPRSWTLWEPLLQNKDIIVTKQNIRLWIDNVTPTLWKGWVLHQNFDTEAIEPSNIIYTIPVAT